MTRGGSHDISSVHSFQVFAEHWSTMAAPQWHNTKRISLLAYLSLLICHNSVKASIFGFRNHVRYSSRLDVLLSLRGGSDKQKIEGPCIGIDLGTTYSCVAVWKNNRVDICPNEQGHRITPSYVAFCKDGTRLVGDSAKNQAPSNPTGTFFDVKRLIGRKFQDATVQKDKTLFPFEVTKDSSGKPILALDSELSSKHSKAKFAPEEISGMVLRKMKEIAETYLGCEVKHAVVTGT